MEFVMENPVFYQKVKQLNKDFANGTIPQDLLFSVEPELKLDEQVIEDMKYLAFYKDFSYYAKRFPYYQSIPGFDRIIQSIADKNSQTNPLEEIISKSSRGAIPLAVGVHRGFAPYPSRSPIALYFLAKLFSQKLI
jgi:hypothetical protein